MDEKLQEIFMHEVKDQAEFCLYAVSQINMYLQNDHFVGQKALWYNIQNFLISSANISKLLWGSRPEDSASRKPLRERLNVAEDSKLRSRRLRNHFEHYDERLKDWYENSARKNYATTMITNQESPFDDEDTFKVFYTNNGHLFFRGEEYPLQPVIEEIAKLKDELKKQNRMF